MKRDERQPGVISRSLRSMSSNGLRDTVGAAKIFVAQRWLGVTPDLTQHRYLLSERICQQTGYSVSYGPFKGMRIDPDSSWSAADRGAMILGLYESEVLAALVLACDGQRTLIDVGAADGYYAVGAVHSGLVPAAVCFEMTPQGQEVIRANALRNAVSDRITILGEATESFLDDIPAHLWTEGSPSVFIFDIEGAEFSLLTQEVLRRLRQSHVILELHEFTATDSSCARDLIRNAEAEFDVAIVGTKTRDPSSRPELTAWSDDDRWLLMSEGRPHLMRWLILTPRASV